MSLNGIDHFGPATPARRGVNQNKEKALLRGGRQEEREEKKKLRLGLFPLIIEEGKKRTSTPHVGWLNDDEYEETKKSIWSFSPAFFYLFLREEKAEHSSS